MSTGKNPAPWLRKLGRQWEAVGGSGRLGEAGRDWERLEETGEAGEIMGGWAFETLKSIEVS